MLAMMANPSHRLSGDERYPLSSGGHSSGRSEDVYGRSSTNSVSDSDSDPDQYSDEFNSDEDSEYDEDTRRSPSAASAASRRARTIDSYAESREPSSSTAGGVSLPRITQSNVVPTRRSQPAQNGANPRRRPPAGTQRTPARQVAKPPKPHWTTPRMTKPVRGMVNASPALSLSSRVDPNDITTHRVTSAKRNRIAALANQNKLLLDQLEGLKHENKALCTENRLNTRALKKYESEENSLASTLKRHQDEVRMLRQQMRKYKQHFAAAEKDLHSRQEELVQSQRKCKQLEQLVQSRDLKERMQLTAELQTLNEQQDMTKGEVSRLKRALELAEKARKRDQAEAQRVRKAHEAVLVEGDERIRQVQLQLKEKEKALQLKNIYSQRITNNMPRTLPPLATMVDAQTSTDDLITEQQDTHAQHAMSVTTLATQSAQITPRNNVQSQLVGTSPRVLAITGGGLAPTGMSPVFSDGQAQQPITVGTSPSQAQLVAAGISPSQAQLIASGISPQAAAAQALAQSVAGTPGDDAKLKSTSTLLPIDASTAPMPDTVDSNGVLPTSSSIFLTQSPVLNADQQPTLNHQAIFGQGQRQLPLNSDGVLTAVSSTPALHVNEPPARFKPTRMTHADPPPPPQKSAAELRAEQESQRQREQRAQEERRQREAKDKEKKSLLAALEQASNGTGASLPTAPVRGLAATSNSNGIGNRANIDQLATDPFGSFETSSQAQVTENTVIGGWQRSSRDDGAAAAAPVAVAGSQPLNDATKNRVKQELRRAFMQSDTEVETEKTPSNNISTTTLAGSEQSIGHDQRGVASPPEWPQQVENLHLGRPSSYGSGETTSARNQSWRKDKRLDSASSMLVQGESEGAVLRQGRRHRHGHAYIPGDSSEVTTTTTTTSSSTEVRHRGGALGGAEGGARRAVGRRPMNRGASIPDTSDDDAFNHRVARRPPRGLASKSNSLVNMGDRGVERSAGHVQRRGSGPNLKRPAQFNRPPLPPSTTSSTNVIDVDDLPAAVGSGSRVHVAPPAPGQPPRRTFHFDDDDDEDDDIEVEELAD